MTTKYDLYDMLPKGGHPIFTSANHPITQESIARRLATTVLMQHMVQETEYFANQENCLGVAATLAEAHNYLTTLISRDALPEEQEAEQQENRPDPFSIQQALIDSTQARKRLDDAVQRHQESIILFHTDHYHHPNVPTFATASSIIAQSAILNFHLQEMKTKGQQNNTFAAEGHNMACHLTATTLVYLRDLITNYPAGRPPGVSKSLMKRVLHHVDTALEQFAKAESDRKHFVPVILHDSVQNNQKLRAKVEQSVAAMIEYDHNFIIDYDVEEALSNTFNIEHCLVLTRHQNVIHVKRVTDEYPMDTPWTTAMEHAGKFRKFALDMDEAEYHACAEVMLEAALHLEYLATAQLHCVPEHTLGNLIKLLEKSCDDPHTHRRAANILFGHNPDLKDHYIQQQPGTVKTMGSPDQIAPIMKAAVESGLTPSQLHILSAFLGADAQEHHLPPRNTRWEDTAEFLEETLKLNLRREDVEDLLIILGYDLDSPQAANWLDDNFNQDDDPDDQHMPPPYSHR